MRGPSDSPWAAPVPRLNDVVEVVAQRDKQIEKQFRALSALFHFCLHGAASLEGLAAPDDERQVVGAQATVRIWGVRIAVLGTS